MLLRLIILVGCVAATTAVDTVVLTLRTEVLVAAESATLGDVAEIQASAEIQDFLRAIPVQELPDLGLRTVTAAEVRALVRRASPSVAVSVRGECRIARQPLAITVEALNDAAVAAVRIQQPTAEVSVGRSAQTVIVPAGGAALELVAESLGSDVLGAVPYRVRVLRQGRELGRALVVVQVAVLGDQVVATRPIAKGAIIDAADVRVARLPQRNGIAAVSTPESLVGCVARSAIAEGAVIPTTAVTIPPAVVGGHSVSLMYVHGDFSLSATAIAQNDARVGEQVQVRRGTDGAVVRATVVSPGVVALVP